MNKAELAATVAEKTHLTKADAERAVTAVLETIIEQVAAGNQVGITGFGTFKSTQRAARKGRNPQNGQELNIPASTAPSFSAGATFKDKVNSKG